MHWYKMTMQEVFYLGTLVDEHEHL
jgi:hypothetical protein